MLLVAWVGSTCKPFKYRWESHCSHIQSLYPSPVSSIVRNNYGGRHQLSVSVAPNFANLHWHPNMTGPKKTVAPFWVHGKNLVLSLLLTNKNKGHWLRLFKMAIISGCKLVLRLAWLRHCPPPAHCWCRSGTSSPDRDPVLWLSKSKEVVPEKALAPNLHMNRFGRTKE